MPNLVDNWTVDRSPGQGKTLIVGGVRTPIGGLVGVGGTGTPPVTGPTLFTLPAAGTVIPPSTGTGSRASYFPTFAAAVAFDGQTALYGWPAGTDSPNFAMAAFVNFGINSIVGYTPNPLQGSLYGQNANSPPSYSYFNTFPSPLGGLYMNTFYSGAFDTGAITWPSDGTTNAGWVQLFMSFKANAVSSKDWAQVVINDTVLFNGYVAQSEGAYTIGYSHPTIASVVKQYIGGDGGNESGTMTDGFKGGVSELWIAQSKFVDWSIKANRDRFRVSDALPIGSAFKVYAPCDIGTAGQKPFGYKPTLYLSGGPSSFVYNRANANAKLSVLTANLSTGLILVDDPPTS